ncbi:TorD/DmsD family molecular chaperone [Mesobacillus subterraneus]|uniref:Molecular chaperone TorD n=1 Tax=Mesobacillus subterraneus TaxID=285983 RepID=A0A3R9EB68_9BACI|nr:molecular chaperone TorD family protein [Mesobacillus subterraneus]RSD27945.1 hypothetical protein EJA10_05615 [Mesobacillus subterraneus]
MIETIDKRTESAQVFRVFAEIYKTPTLEIWKEITQNDLLPKLRDAVQELYQIKTTEWKDVQPDSYDQLISSYMATIGKAAIPVESLYKPWTQDETCTLAFAREKGYLQGDSALHIRFILNEMQISIPSEYEGTPDHLAILLELLAYFIEHAPKSFTAEFIGDHFDWLDNFAFKLESNTGQTFYLEITRVLIATMKAFRSTYL